MSPESEKKRREEGTPHGKGSRTVRLGGHLLGWFTEGSLLKLLTRSTNLEDVRDLQSIL